MISGVIQSILLTKAAWSAGRPSDEKIAPQHIGRMANFQAGRSAWEATPRPQKTHESRRFRSTENRSRTNQVWLSNSQHQSTTVHSFSDSFQSFPSTRQFEKAEMEHLLQLLGVRLGSMLATLSNKNAVGPSGLPKNPKQQITHWSHRPRLLRFCHRPASRTGWPWAPGVRYSFRQ